MKNLGDYTPGKTIVCRFNTHKADGTPITLAGTPACSVYKTGSTTESTSGVTLTVDYDSRTGLHYVAVDTSADGTFYAAGSDFDIVITTGTVDSVSVVGTVVGTFSLSNRAALRPTTADRTLDVTATGEAGIDLANVGGATTTLNLSGTTIKAVTDAVTAGTVSDKTGYSLANLTVQASTILATGTHNPQSGDAFSRIGAPAGASVSADIAGVLSAVQGINNLSALANIYGSPLLEIPDSGSTEFAFTVVVRDNEGKLVDLDASPTIAASNAAGTSRSANLSAVSHPATGRYTFTYSVASNAAEESLRITVSGAVSAEARYVEWIGAVVDYDTLTTLSSVATQVNAIHGKLPSKSYLAGTNNSDGDIQLDEATGQAFPANFSSLAISGAGKVTVGTNDDKTGYSLTQTFPSNFSSLAITGAGAVTAGTVGDKAGYSVAANGLGLVLIEQSISSGSGLVNDSGTQLTSITLPQAVSLVLSAAAGLVAGASSNSPAFKPAGKGSASARISSTVTSDGRTAINLRVPD